MLPDMSFLTIGALLTDASIFNPTDFSNWKNVETVKERSLTQTIDTTTHNDNAPHSNALAYHTNNKINNVVAHSNAIAYHTNNKVNTTSAHNNSNGYHGNSSGHNNYVSHSNSGGVHSNTGHSNYVPHSNSAGYHTNSRVNNAGSHTNTGHSNATGGHTNDWYNHVNKSWGHTNQKYVNAHYNYANHTDAEYSHTDKKSHSNNKINTKTAHTNTGHSNAIPHSNHYAYHSNNRVNETSSHSNSGGYHSNSNGHNNYVPHSNSGGVHTNTGHTNAVPHSNSEGYHTNTGHTNAVPHSNYSTHTNQGFDHQNFIPSTPSLFNMNGETLLRGTSTIGLFSYDKNNDGTGTQDSVSKVIKYQLQIRKIKNLDNTASVSAWRSLLNNSTQETYTLNTIDPLGTGNTNIRATEGFYEIQAIAINDTISANGVSKSYVSDPKISTVKILQNQDPTISVANGNEFISFTFSNYGVKDASGNAKSYSDTLYSEDKANQTNGLFLSLRMTDMDTNNWQKSSVYLQKSDGTKITGSDANVLWENGSEIIQSAGVTKKGYIFIAKEVLASAGNLTDVKVITNTKDYTDASCTVLAGANVVQSTVSQGDSTNLLLDIDITPPTVTLTPNTTAWTKNDVVVTVSATDNNAGISTIQLPNGTIVSGATASYIIGTNGTYNFKVTDKAGNVTTKTITVSNLDKSLPSYTSCSVQNQDENGYDVFVYGVADTGSGVNRVQFPTWTELNGQDEIQSDWTNNAVATGINLGGGTWKYHVAKTDHNNEMGRYNTHVYGVDNAGNMTSLGGIATDLIWNRNASIVDSTPTTVEAGKAYTATVTVNNTGGYPWSETEQYRLGGNPFGDGRTYIPTGTTTLSGQSRIFTVTGTAPTTPGTYTGFYQMLQEGVTWFGPRVAKTIIVVDTTAPTVPTITSNVPNGAWQNVANFTFNIAGSSDIGSGISHYEYSLDSGVTWKDYNAPVVITPEGYHCVFARTVDKSGNTSPNTGIYQIGIDRTAPTLALSQNPSVWINGGDVTVTVSATDNIGISNITLPDNSVINGSSATFVVIGNGTHTFKTTDYAGNVTTKSITISNYDTVNPTATLMQTPTTWTNGDVTLNLSATDGQSGVKQIKLPNGTIVTTSSASQVVNANGIYTFEITDNAGNVTTKSLIVSNIDKIVPNAPILNKDVTGWTNGNVKVIPEYPVADKSVNMLNNGDFLNGLTSWSASMPDGSVTLNNIDTPYGKGVRVTKAVGTQGYWPLDNISTNTYKAGQTYTFSWNYKVTKGSGRPYSVGWWLNDNGAYQCTLPVKEVLLENGWIHAEASYKFTADFTLTGATFVNSMPDNTTVEFANVKLTESTMEYKIGSTGTWTPYTSLIELTINNTVYARYTDFAGNVSPEGNITVSNIDKTLATATITQTPTAWTNGDVKLSVATTDSQSGVKQIKLPNGSIVTEISATYTVNINGTYTFEITDNVGNITTKSIIVSNIDKVKPTVTIVNNQNWNNSGGVQVDISAIDNIVVNNTTSGIDHIEYSLSGATVQAWTTYSSLTVINEGVTNITARAIDKVGNVSDSVTSIVKLDRSKPINSKIEIIIK